MTAFQFIKPFKPPTFEGAFCAEYVDAGYGGWVRVQQVYGGYLLEAVQPLDPTGHVEGWVLLLESDMVKLLNGERLAPSGCQVTQEKADEVCFHIPINGLEGLNEVCAWAPLSWLEQTRRELREHKERVDNACKIMKEFFEEMGIKGFGKAL